MSVFNLFRRRGTAPVARERLQILLAHERSTRGQPDLLAVLREEILAAIAKHVTVDQDRVDRAHGSRCHGLDAGDRSRASERGRPFEGCGVMLREIG